MTRIGALLSLLALTGLVALGGLSTAGRASSVSQTVVIQGDDQGEEGESLAFSTLVVGTQPGEVLTYDWQFGDGSGGVSGVGRSSSSHRFAQNDDYTVTVTVRGTLGYIGSGRFDVRVDNAAPTLVRLEKSSRFVGDTFDFDADIYEPGDDTVTYRWEFGDGSPARSGIDLNRLTHMYPDTGSYPLKIVLKDQDGDSTIYREIVRVDPLFQATIDGHWEGAPVHLEISGYATASLRIPGAGMPGAVVTPGGNMGGAFCLLGIAGWDDEKQAFMTFAALSDYPYEARRYRQVRADASTARNVFASNVAWGGGDIGYMGAKAMYQGASGNSMTTLGALAGRIPGANLGNPEDSRTYSSSAGQVNIERFLEDRIEATFSGTYYFERRRGVTAAQVNVTGHFVLKLTDEALRRQVQFCGRAPFKPEVHWPKQNEKNIDFVDPGIRVQFTKAYDSLSVNDSSFAVGYLDEQSNFVLVDGTFRHDDDETTLYFDPDDKLLDHIRYRVRLKGGRAGLLSRTGEQMADNYEWGFWTVPDLVQNATRISAASIPLLPQPRFLGPGALANPAQVTTPRSGLYSECASPDVPQSIVPVVHVSVYQTLCNAPLVLGKRTAVRVYALWSRHYGTVAQTEELEVFDAEVEVLDGNGTPLFDAARMPIPKQDAFFFRPDRETYDKYGIKTFLPNNHSLDITNWVPQATSRSPLKVTVTPKGNLPWYFSATRTGARSFSVLDCDTGCLGRQGTTAPELAFEVLYPTVGPWANAVPPTVMHSNNQAIGGGALFTLANTPLRSMPPQRLRQWQIAEPVGRKRGPYCWSPNHGTYDCDAYDGAEVWAMTGSQAPHPVAVSPSRYLEKMFELTQEGSPLVASVLIVPPSVTEGFRTNPSTLLPEKYSYWEGRTLGRYDKGLILLSTRLLATVIGPYLVAHEFGHYLGLEHCARTPDRGFLMLLPAHSGSIRDSREGNTDAAKVAHSPRGVMDYGLSDPQGAPGRLLERGQYEELLRNVTALPGPYVRGANDCDDTMTAPAGPPPPSSWAGVTAPRQRWPLTGGFGSAIGPPIPFRVWSGTPTRVKTQIPGSRLVSGIITSDGSAAGLLPIRESPVAPPDSSTASGPYWVVQLDAAGNAVHRFGFDPASDPANALTNPTEDFFSARVPMVPGVVSVDVRDSAGGILGSRARSQSAPQVSINVPASSVWRGVQRLTWSGSDADGDSLRYVVSYSPTGVAPWSPLGFTIADSMDVNTVLLEPGPAPTVRVTASDGFNDGGAATSVRLANDVQILYTQPFRADSTPVWESFGARFLSPLDTTQTWSRLFVVQDSMGISVSGTTRYDDASRTLEFLPDRPLDHSAAYTATLSAAVLDRYGNRLATDHVWTVTTEPDVVAPRVVQTFPTSYAITAYPEDPLSVEFSEAMDPSSITMSSFVLSDSAGRPVAGAITYDPIRRVATMTPDTSLALRSRYTVTVDSTVTDMSGNGVVRPFVWHFNTVGNLRPSRRN